MMFKLLSDQLKGTASPPWQLALHGQALSVKYDVEQAYTLTGDNGDGHFLDRRGSVGRWINGCINQVRRCLFLAIAHD